MYGRPNYLSMSGGNHPPRPHEWDPMVEDYYDPNFNSYNYGPGSKLETNLQPWNQRKGEKRLYKLHVGNVPHYMNDKSLGNYLINVSAPPPLEIHVNTHSTTDKTWAFISYSKHSDAEKTIRLLNMMEPLFLKVQFARSDEERNRLRAIAAAEEETWKTSLSVSPYNVPEPPMHNRRLSGRGRGNRLSLPTYGMRDDVYYRGDSEAELNGFLINPDDPNYRIGMHAMDELNFQIASDSANRRRISMGRAISRGSAERTPGRRTSPRAITDPTGSALRFEAGSPPPTFTPGHCVFCNKVATQVCGRCERVFYCSQECQRRNWDLHKPFCKPLLSTKADESSGTPRQEPLGQSNGEVNGSSSPLKQNASQRMVGSGSQTVDQLATKTDGLNRSGKGGGNVQLGLLGEYPGKVSILDNTLHSNTSSDGNYIQRNNGRQGDNDRVNEMKSVDRRNDRGNEVIQDAALLNSSVQGNTSSDRNYMQRNDKRQGDNDNERRSGMNSGDRRNDRRSEGGYQQSRNNQGENQGCRPRNNDRFARPRNEDGNERRSSSKSRNGGDRQGEDGNERQSYGRSRNANDRQGEDGNMRQSYGNVRNTNDRPGYGKERVRHDGNERDQRSGQGGRFGYNREGGRTGQRNNGGRPNARNWEGQQHSKTAEIGEDEEWGVDSTPTLQQSSPGESSQEKSTEETSVEALPKESTLNDCMNGELSSSETPVKSSEEIPSRAADLETVKLPAGVFSEVKVAVPEGSGVYWVQITSMETELLNIMTELLSLNENSPGADVKVGTLCAADFEGMWFRSKVVITDPELKVHYIDYGNTEVVKDKASLKSLPESSKSLPGQAIKIRVADGTSDKWKNLGEEETFLVKPVKTVNGVVLVHVEGEVYEEEKPVSKTPVEEKPVSKTPVEEKPVPQSPIENVDLKTREISVADSVPSSIISKCVEDKANVPQSKGAGNERKLLDSCLSLLKCGTIGFLECTVLLGPGVFLAVVASKDFEDIYRKVMGDDLEKEASVAPVLPNPQPKDLVLAKSVDSKGKWQRAYIISVKEKEYSVAFCDTGKLEKVNEVKDLLGSYRNICAMTLKCSVTDYLSTSEQKFKEMLEITKRFKFEVIDTSETAAVVFLKELAGEEPHCRAKLSAWVPPFRNSLTCVELKDGPYVLSSFITTKTMYVRPADKSSVIGFGTLLQEVNGYCYKTPFLSEKPCLGDLVAAKFSGDDNYYRALVRNIDEDDIKVIYVDFGNSEILKLNRMKSLPENLKATPCFAVKVGLKDIVEEPLNKDCGKFLGEIAQEEVELKLKVTDLSNRQVELYLPDGTSVNGKLKSILTPSWEAKKTTPADVQIFRFDEMLLIDLPVGQTIKVAILEVLMHNQIAVMNMDDPALFESVAALSPKINEYCSSDKNSYVPREGEMCLALFGGEWFRAVCLGSDKDISVMFVDFGNTALVKHTEVRRMVKEFFEIAPVAYICAINGIPDESPSADRIEERLKELLPLNSFVQVKILKKEESIMYTVDIPTVTANLKNEGLLQ